MKRVLCAVIALLVASSAATGQDRGFGIGVILGEPTGVSGKGWLSSRSAFDAGLAWSFRGNGYIHAHMDYLWHFADAVNTEQQILPYLGVGGRVVGRNGSSIAGVRMVGGFAWLPEGTPLDVFLEIAPVLDLAPATEMSVNGGLGMRFFFH